MKRHRYRHAVRHAAGANPCRARLRLEGELERLLGRRVDLIDLSSVPADLVHRVLRDGDVVVDRDRARQLRFEVARRNEYFNLEPVRRRHHRLHDLLAFVAAIRGE